MSDQEAPSWLGSLLTRAGLPTAVLVALGALAFFRGLSEPINRHNSKLVLAAGLIIGGFLWRAGSEWRFHTEKWSVVFSVHALAVLFWLALLGGLLYGVWAGAIG